MRQKWIERNREQIMMFPEVEDVTYPSYKPKTILIKGRCPPFSNMKVYDQRGKTMMIKTIKV